MIVRVVALILRAPARRRRRTHLTLHTALTHQTVEGRRGAVDVVEVEAEREKVVLVDHTRIHRRILILNHHVEDAGRTHQKRNGTNVGVDLLPMNLL